MTFAQIKFAFPTVTDEQVFAIINTDISAVVLAERLPRLYDGMKADEILAVVGTP